MHHLLTIGATDGEIGNIFGHAFAAYSTTNGLGDKIKINGLWGFYAEATNTRIPVITALKEKLFGLNIDISGNHGKFIEEEMRYYDLGYGLHGATFEISQAQSEALLTYMDSVFKDQKEAASNGNKALKSLGVSSPSSYQRYRLELARAAQFDESPRLKPFELNLKFSMWGPSFQDSYTCKSGAINIAKGAHLAETHINRLTNDGKDFVFPRNSGPYESLFWHSTGTRQKHISKRTGKTHYFRDFRHNELYWTLPPQEIIDFNDKLSALCLYPKAQLASCKSTISHLQRLEKIIVEADVNASDVPKKEAFINKITSLYQQFSTLSYANEEKVSHQLLKTNVFFERLRAIFFDDLNASNTPESFIHCLAFKHKEKICKVLNFPKLIDNTADENFRCCC